MAKSASERNKPFGLEGEKGETRRAGPREKKGTKIPRERTGKKRGPPLSSILRRSRRLAERSEGKRRKRILRRLTGGNRGGSRLYRARRVEKKPGGKVADTPALKRKSRGEEAPPVEVGILQVLSKPRRRKSG